MSDIFHGIVDPDRLYTPMELGEDILRLESNVEDPKGRRRSIMNRVYNIPERELPRVRTGPRGGNVRFAGRDIIRYLESRRSNGTA